MSPRQTGFEKKPTVLQSRFKFQGGKTFCASFCASLNRRLKAGFSVCWLCSFVALVALVLSEMHEVRTFAPCKAFLFDMFAFFSSLENYFGFRTTNVKVKTDHSVSLRWNKRFWTFLKRRVFFWLCMRWIYELISPGWIKTHLYFVISSYSYFFYMPRFKTFAEPALSLSKNHIAVITHQSEQTCALMKLSRK